MSAPTFPTDLSTPGAIDRLLAAHRSVFGDLRMEDDGGNGDGQEAPEGEQQGANERPTLEQVIADLNLTPEQIAGRLTASRKWEQRAKERVDYDDIKAERDALKQASETDVEKAVREAREAGAAEARQASYDSTAKALLRMGLKARGVAADDLDEIVTQANLAAFAGEDGDVDDEKISRYVERNAGTASTQQWPGTGQDRRGGGTQKESGSDLWEKHYGTKK